MRNRSVRGFSSGDESNIGSLVDVQLFERPHPFPFEKSRFLKSKNPKPPDSSLPVCENNPAITIMTSRPNENHSAPRQRFSMIRNFVAADWLTLGNGFCGTGSVLSVLQYLVSAETIWLYLAMALIPLALIFDFADGRVSRWRRSSSLGADLDSLADIVSFGVAPAVIGFAVGLRASLDVVFLLYFVACGISRLARFNATADALTDETGKVSHFEGTPIPTSVVIVALLAFLHHFDLVDSTIWLGRWELGPMSFHPLAFIYAASGTAMISTIRIPKI